MSSRQRGFLAGLAACVLVGAPVTASQAEEANANADAVGEVDTKGDQIEAGRQVKSTGAKVRGIEEITVTARRKEESLELAPLTVTAFDDEQLEQNDIRSLEDIASLVPNLQFDAAAGQSNASRIYLRGVGNGDTIITDDNGVGIYVDSVFLPRAAGTLLAVSDVERVEVLAGPQGTLYGKNTIGGLVNYITKKPQWETEGRASVRFGTFGQLDTGFMYNMPIVPEKVALRVSLATRSTDGYATNEFTNNKVQDNRSLNGRVQLLLQPTDDLEVLFSAAQSIAREQGNPAKCALDGPVNETGLNATLFPGFSQGCVDDEKRSVRKIARDGQLEDHLKTINTYMQVNWSPSKFLTIKSNTAWNRNKTSGSGDGDATIFPVNNGASSDFDKGHQDSIAQELNLSGEFELANRKINWIGGVFGLVEDNFDKIFDTDRPGVNANVGNVIAPGRTASGMVVETITTPAAATAAAAAARIPIFAATNGFGPCLDTPVRLGVNNSAGLPVELCTRNFQGIQTKSRLRSNVLSYAAFGSFDIALTEKLNFSLGARYTHERRRVSRFRQVNEDDKGRLVSPGTRVRALSVGVVTPAPGLRETGVLTDFERSLRIGKWTPSLSLTWAATDNVTTYISHSRGFKSGGFNGRGLGDGNERVQYDPEILSNYEVGFKTNWFDRRLIVNAAYFHSDYKGIQLPNVQNTNMARVAVVVDNAGRASINGMDLSFTVLPPIDGLTLRGTFGITAGRYEKFDDNPNDRLIGSPTYTGSMTAAYSMPVGSFGELTSRLSWSHQGQKSSDASDNRSTHINKYGTLSGGLTWDLPDGRTQIALNGSNLLNREYFLTGIDVGDTALRYYAPPRQMSVEIRRTF